MFLVKLNDKVVAQAETFYESIKQWSEIAMSEEFRKNGGKLEQWDNDRWLGGTTLNNTGEFYENK
jgi:hypothetical protein